MRMEGWEIGDDGRSYGYSSGAVYCIGLRRVSWWCSIQGDNIVQT